MDGVGDGEVATELAVPVADGCVVSPTGEVDRILHRTEEEEEIEAKGLNVSSEFEDDFLILDEAKVDDEEGADRSNNAGDAGGQEGEMLARIGHRPHLAADQHMLTRALCGQAVPVPLKPKVNESAVAGRAGGEEVPASTSSPKSPEADKASADEEEAGESAPPGCEDGDETEAEEKPGDKSGKEEASDEKAKRDSEDSVLMAPEEEEAKDDEDTKSIEDPEKPESPEALDVSTVSTEDIDKEVREEPAEEPAEEPVEETVEEPTEEPAEESAEETAEEPAEKSFNSSSDDVLVIAVTKLTDQELEVKDSSEGEELDVDKDEKKPLFNGNRKGDPAVPASGKEKEDTHEAAPIEMDEDKPIDSKPLKQLVSTCGRVILADLKRALNVDIEPGKPKRLKLDVGDGEGDALEVEMLGGGGDSVPGANVVADAAGDTVSASGRDLVMVSRKQLEQYVLKRARSCLQLHAPAVLRPMEKKCDALHSALQRWRRRSYQLQRQLNEFICEQEKCANARRGRRSVGVCVRMPPLKQPQPPPLLPASSVKTIPTTVTAPVSVTAPRTSATIVTTMASSGTSPVRPPAPPQQLRVTGTNASMLAAQLGLKPNQHMKLVSVSTPSGGTTTVVTRMPPQLQSAPSTSAAPSTPTSGPVPMQLIANTATLTSSPNQVAKAVTIPTSSAGSAVGGSPVRTVTVLPPPGVAGSASPSAVKFIDLTQEEEAGNAQGKVISVSGVSVANAIQKLTVPTSGIPVLSAAPTSLVQMPPSSSQGHTRVSIGGTSVVLTTPVTGTMSQSGGTMRLNPPLVGPPTRVTYLVPSLPPGMVVTPREVGPPRLAPAGSPQPLQTILLRMASPQSGFASVPGGAITMGNLVSANQSGGPTPGGPPAMMVATTPSGSQVRMVRAPPPMTLQRAGATLTLPPGTTLVRSQMGTPPTVRPGTEQVSVVRQTTPVTTVASSSLQLPTVRVNVPKPPTLQVPPKPPALQAPPKPILQVHVPPSVSAAVSKPSPSKTEPIVSLIKHPAALPPTPRYIDDPKKKRIPPKPSLKISRTPSANAGTIIATVAIKPMAVAKRKPALPPKKEEPKQPTAEDVEKLVQQWQTYLDSQQGGEDGKKEDSAKEQKRRMPYHAQRPLRQACLCQLGTCRYDRLPVAYKERLHANFGRLEPDQQLRVLLGRMYTGGKAKRERQKRRKAQEGSAASDAAAGPKGRCKWVYWLPAPGSKTLRRKVCKAAFMGVHGITEKRARDVQLLWMRLKAKRGRTPTGDESDIEREELMPGAYTDVDDDDGGVEEKGVESERKPKRRLPARWPSRGRKILRVSESEGSSSEAADSGPGGKGGDDDDEWKPEDEDEVEPPSAKSSRVTRQSSEDVKVKTKEPSPEASQDSVAVATEAGDGEADEVDDDDDNVPYLDISGFEPICSLEVDSENLVLSLPQGVFVDSKEITGAT